VVTCSAHAWAFAGDFEMNPLPTPSQTTIARQWLTIKNAKLDRVQQALLATVDGHRNIVELESVARAMGLAPSALETMRQQGLIEDTAAVAMLGASSAGSATGPVQRSL
jgi:hypothetical protein